MVWEEACRRRTVRPIQLQLIPSMCWVIEAGGFSDTLHQNGSMECFFSAVRKHGLQVRLKVGMAGDVQAGC